MHSIDQLVSCRPLESYRLLPPGRIVGNSWNCPVVGKLPGCGVRGNRTSGIHAGVRFPRNSNIRQELPFRERESWMFRRIFPYGPMISLSSSME